MNPRFLKIFLRLIGTIAGLVGVGAFSFSAAMLGEALSEERNQFFWWFAAVSLVIDLYLIWVCYLVWFRFSPRSTLHVCGALGFVVLCIPAAAVSDNLNGAWGLAFFIWFLVVVQGYSSLNRYFNRVLFGPDRVS